MVKPTERRVGYGVALGYGVTDLFGGGAFTIIGTWLLFFYTTYCGLSVIEAGSIFAIARVIDALLSPIMGYITDNFGDTWLGRKFGRRRFFLLLSSPLMFLYALLWLTDMGYWYYLGTYLSIELLSAMVLVPWETLAAEMTNRYEERSRLSGVRIDFSSPSVGDSSFSATQPNSTSSLQAVQKVTSGVRSFFASNANTYFAGVISCMFRRCSSRSASTCGLDTSSTSMRIGSLGGTR